MGNAYRKRSEGDIYHITMRGMGRQVIFECDDDRRHFLESLVSAVKNGDGELLAWCLMDNHVHLLLHEPIEQISRAMQSLCTSYAKYFNLKYDRVGSLFQGRFGSVAIESDSQLLACVRYIHLNPTEIGQPLTWRWSSYRDYLGNAGPTDTRFVMSIVGGETAFKNLHYATDAPAFKTARHRMTESEARETAVGILGDVNPYELRSLARAERNSYLRKMKEAGISIRQIERITSIGRGIISKA